MKSHVISFADLAMVQYMHSRDGRHLLIKYCALEKNETWPGG